MAYSYIEYIAAGGATFNIPFEYIDQSEIEVYVDGIAATFTFTSSNTVNVTPTPTSGSTVRVGRVTDLSSRAVDFTAGSVLTEEDMDNSIIQVFHAAQESMDKVEGTIVLAADGKFNGNIGGADRIIKNVADPVNPQDVATKNYIENTWLTDADKAQLNALDTTKLATVANDIANVNTTAANITNVNNVGGSIANVNTVVGSLANVTTVSSNIADVNTVATNIGDINTVENSIANVNAIANDITNVDNVATYIHNVNSVSDNMAPVNDVATDIANVNTVAVGIADVQSVAANSTNVNTVAGAITNVNNVGGNIADVNTVAGSIANVNTVATDIAKVNQVAADISKVITTANDLLETNGSEIETVAASIANVDAVGTNISNVNTVAANLTSINSFEDTYSISATAPTTGVTEGDLWFNTTADMMMVYNGNGWQPAGSSVNGTSARFKFTATANQTAFTGSDANGNTLEYDVGYIDVYLNGVHLDPSDYTADDTSTITLASGAAAGDELYIVAFGTFALSAHYTKAETDNLLAGIASDALIDSGGTTRVQATTSGAEVTGDITLASDDTGLGRGDNSISFNDASNFVRFFTANGERMRIDSSGNVGIGTDSPATSLSVAASGVNGIQLAPQIGSANSSSRLFLTSPTSTQTLYNYNNGFSFRTSATVGGSSGTERFRIDANGRVTMPYQPAFLAKKSSQQTLASSTKVTFADQDVDKSNNYDTSNSRFTAPVNGTYAFSINLRLGVEGKIRVATFAIRKNGSNVYARGFGIGGINDYDSGGGYDHPYVTGTVLLTLSANDYIELWTGSEIQYTGTCEIQTGNGVSSFMGYLIG